MEITKCVEIHDCLIGGTKYKELAKEGVKLSELSKYPLLLLEDMSNTRKQLDRFAAENGIYFKPIIELASYDLLIEFAKINLGLTFIIRAVSYTHLDVYKRQATSRMGFGGVGASGMGAYHGKIGFDAFSHKKSIVDKKTWMDLPMRYQPYKQINEMLIKMFLR